MEWKSIIILIAIVSCLALGCISDSQAIEQEPVSDSQAIEHEPVSNNYIMEFVRDCDPNEKIKEWRDKETGVHYFIYSEKLMNAGFGGIIPRYNADGSLYVD